MCKINMTNNGLVGLPLSLPLIECEYDANKMDLHSSIYNTTLLPLKKASEMYHNIVGPSVKF